MDREALGRLEPALEVFLESFAGCAVAPTRRLISTYVRGQLSALPRKSVKPMALEAGVPPRTLQELLSLHRWDEGLLMALLQRRVRRARPGTQGFGFFFESRCIKKGDHTPGVSQQVCEVTARARNCVVFVNLGFSDGDFRCLLGSAIYLPESWTNDPGRRRVAGIPDEVVYRTKARIASDLLRRAESNGLDLRRLVVPAEYAADGALAESLRNGGRVVASRPSSRMSVTPPAGLSGDSTLQILREDAEARKVLDERMGHIGFDHFEVRAYRSLLRHLALSCASLLFLAEEHARSRDQATVSRRSRA